MCSESNPRSPAFPIAISVPVDIIFAMTSAEKFSAALTKLESEAVSSIADLGGSIDALTHARQDSNSDDEHDPEGATIAYERSQSDALLRQAQQHLTDILAARVRLADGTFGTCVECGSKIAQARLGARPYASTCIACAS